MRTFRALTTCIAVDVQGDSAELALADVLTACYPPATGEPAVRYELGNRSVRRNGVELVVSERTDVIPAFELDLYEQVVATAAPGWLLHAMAVEVADAAVVVCGSSGAGKTTLSLALGARGHRILTEEIVWIDRSGLVRGLPRPLHVPAHSPQQARIPPGWKQHPYPIRGRDGGVQEHVLVVPPATTIQSDSLPLHALVRAGHGPGWRVFLERSANRVALERLWDRSFRHDEGDLEAATEILRTHGSYELSSTSESEALELLSGLLNRL